MKIFVEQIITVRMHKKKKEEGENIMLTNQTIEKLQRLKFSGMEKAFEEQLQMPQVKELSFEERFGFLVDRELTERENRKLTNRLRKAQLKENACIENIDFKNTRGIEKSIILSLSDCEWARRKQNIIISGPTGVGKTYISCALAQKACREGLTAVYYRISRLFEELEISKGDGRYIKTLEKVSKSDVLVLDDFGISVLEQNEREHLLEIIEDRYNIRSTIIATQVPIEKWHEVIHDLTIADAILDRLVHNAHKIEMQGSSMRKKKNITEIQKEK